MAWDARRLKEARERRGWTQEELAARLRVHRVEVARWEADPSRADARRPSLPSLEKLARALGVKITELLRGR